MQQEVLMTKTVVGRFATQAAAEQVAHELETLVPEPREIQVIENAALRGQHEPGADEGLWDRLMDEVRAATADDSDADAAALAGPVYVVVNTGREGGSLARDIMAQSGLAERLEEYIVPLAA
jgi:hypothetical protein